MKKASVEVQFNWIFVLIAGSMILIAFFAFILKQKAANDQAMAESLVKDIAFLAEGAASAKKSWQSIDGTKKPIEPLCAEDCSCSLNVGGFSEGFGDLTLFVPSVLEGSKLVFWSQDWSVPFRTTNFLYMSSQNIKYWFIYGAKDDPVLEDMTSIFPSDLTMETIQVDKVGTIEAEDYEQIKLIFIDSGFFTIADLKRKLDKTLEDVDVKGVLIDSSRNQITFYEKLEAGTLDFEVIEMPFAGLATILGAVFSEDSNMYGCQVEKALERAESVIRIYAERTEDLNDANIEGCSYQEAIQSLRSMANNAGTLSVGIKGQKMSFPIEALEQINRDLLNQGCPLVY